MWCDSHEELIDRTVKPRDAECSECGPTAAVFAKTVEDTSVYDWKCASCGYTPEWVEGA